MKNNFFRTLPLIVLLIASALIVQNAQAESVAVLKEIKGEVFYQPVGSSADQWKPVTSETPVNNGDSVKTVNGSCLLSYGVQGDFRLESNTSLTVKQKTDSQNISLLMGKLKARVDSKKTLIPFQVVTPTAIGAVRGTEVDFDYNGQGLMTIDLHQGGPVQVYNDTAGMDLVLKNGNKISVFYDKDKGELTISNSCDSGSQVSFSFLGTNYSVDQCKSKTVAVTETAAGPQETPGTGQDNKGSENNPDENKPNDTVPQSSSPTAPAETT